MTRCIPEQPPFTTEFEREVWDRLREQLGPEDILIGLARRDRVVDQASGQGREDPPGRSGRGRRVLAAQ